MPYAGGFVDSQQVGITAAAVGGQHSHETGNESECRVHDVL
jgi:hypothetical protein